MTMRFYINECLSPAFAAELLRRGHDAIHPLHTGRRSLQDHTIAREAIAEDRVIVTENIADFKKLLVRESLHPGLIALPQTSKARGLAMILEAVEFLETRSRHPMNEIINSCIEFAADGTIRLTALAAP